MPRGRNRSRAGVTAVLFLLCVGPLLAVVHEFGADHRYCPEHQALEEGGAGAELVAAMAVQSAAAESETTVASPSESAGHAECPIAQALASSVMVPGPSATSLPRQVPKTDELKEASSPPSSLAVLTLAPKTSPPNRV